MIFPLDHFLRKYNLKIAILLIIKSIFDRNLDRHTLIHSTSQIVQFLDTLPPNNLTPQLKNQRAANARIIVKLFLIEQY